MPVPTQAQYVQMLDAALKGHYALPAVNVSNLVAVNAALKGFADAKCDGIIQFSLGGAKFASGQNISDSVYGAIVLANTVRALADKYNIFVALHTDHCQPKFAESFLDPLIHESRKRVDAGLPTLFNSHMLDASDLPLEENLSLSSSYLEKCNALGMLLEIEIGVVGGEEEGAVSGSGEKSYTSPHDMIRVFEKLGESHGRYLLAATFGNVHGSYKPGFVKLKPKILEYGQIAVEKKYGEKSKFYLVFHGGSGSTPGEIHESVEYGVVKMNIDTDTQYAFTKPIALHCCEKIEGVLKIDGEVGEKKAYDPRSYLKKAEESMAQRVGMAADNLGAIGKTLFGTI